MSVWRKNFLSSYFSWFSYYVITKRKDWKKNINKKKTFLQTFQLFGFSPSFSTNKMKSFTQFFFYYFVVCAAYFMWKVNKKLLIKYWSFVFFLSSVCWEHEIPFNFPFSSSCLGNFLWLNILSMWMRENLLKSMEVKISFKWIDNWILSEKVDGRKI